MKTCATGTIMRWVAVLVAGMMPLLIAGECTDERSQQIRTDIATPISNMIGSLGDVAGAYVAAVIKPLPDASNKEPSLK